MDQLRTKQTTKHECRADESAWCKMCRPMLATDSADRLGPTTVTPAPSSSVPEPCTAEPERRVVPDCKRSTPCTCNKRLPTTPNERLTPVTIRVAPNGTVAFDSNTVLGAVLLMMPCSAALRRTVIGPPAVASTAPGLGLEVLSVRALEAATCTVPPHDKALNATGPAVNVSKPLDGPTDRGVKRKNKRLALSGQQVSKRTYRSRPR